MCVNKQIVSKCFLGYMHIIWSTFKFLFRHALCTVVCVVICIGFFLLGAAYKVLSYRASALYELAVQKIEDHWVLQCLLSVVIFLLVAWLIVFVRFFLRKLFSESNGIKVNPRLIKHSLGGMDSPVLTENDDLLDRAPFVTAVLNAIKESCKTPDAAFIALYGAWGEGKTSVSNILADRINKFEHNIEIVKFEPWGSRDKEGYAVELCTTLANASCRMGRCDGAIDLQMLGAKLSQSSIWDAITAQSGFGNFLNSIIKAFCGQDTLKRRVTEFLDTLPDNQRFLVVIDDVDRLMHNEIIELIRLIRTNCNFPKVTYLVLADQRHVEVALGREIVGDNKDNPISAGHEYLEKIFPIAFKLPRLPKERLPNLLLGRIKKLLSNKRLSPISEVSCAAKILKLLVKTMRHVQQCADYIDSQLFYLYVNPQNHSRPCICEDDFISLTLIRYFYPDVYATLYEEKDDLLARKKWREEELDAFFNLKQDKAKKNAVWLFLNNILHFKVEYRNDKSGKAQAYWGVDYKYNDAMRDYRMVVPLCYDNYFTGYTERFVAIPKSQVEEFAKEVAKDPQGSRIEELLKTYYSNGYLRPLFYALQGDRDVLQDNNVPPSNLVHAFAKIAAICFDNKTCNIRKPITCLVKEGSLYSDLIECLRAIVVKRYPKQGERGEFLKDIFAVPNMDCGMLLLLAMLLELECAAHHKPNGSELYYDSDHLIWNDVDYNRLLTLFAEKVRMVKIDSRPNETLLREKWLWLSRMCEWNEEIRNSYDEAVPSVMSEPSDTVLHWLLPFLTELADEDNPWVVGFNYKELKGMKCFKSVLEFFNDRGSLLPPAWELIGKYLLWVDGKIDFDNRRYTMRDYIHDDDNYNDFSVIVSRYEHGFSVK